MMAHDWFQLVALFGTGVLIGGLINMQSLYKTMLGNIENKIAKSLEPRTIEITVDSRDKDIVGHMLNYTRKSFSSVPLIIPRPLAVEPGQTIKVDLDLMCRVPDTSGFVIHPHKLKSLTIPKPGNQVICLPGTHESVIVPLKNESERTVHVDLGTIGFHLYAGDFGKFNVILRT